MILTPSGPGVISRLKHRLVTSDGRILLHMSVHLGVKVQREEALQQVEGLRDDLLGDPMVLNVEETTFRAGIVYVLGNTLPCFE